MANELNRNDNRIKLACYATNVTMAVTGNLTALLFLTFRSLYGITFTELGFLVAINFFTQLTIDLIFSFFSHKFNIPLVVKLTPLITIVGLIVFALSPIVFSNNIYLGLLIGTVIFSASNGLAEVLMSPTIAALPFKDPEHAMSKLHAVYAWGAVAVAIFITVFLFIFDKESWQWLALTLCLIPLTAFILFLTAKHPEMQTNEKIGGVKTVFRNKQLWICFIAIFLGGASEIIMGQWSSSYLEQMGLPKIWGDIFGVAVFSATLGLGRTWYSKYGKNIEKFIFIGAIGATACYLLGALSPFAVIGLIGCALTGFFVSMMWPGSLIIVQERVPNGGVLIFALMASGGDMGAAVGPQLVGVVTDLVTTNANMVDFAYTLGLTVEQLGMKVGLLLGSLFPILAIVVYSYLVKSKEKIKLLNEKTI